VLLVLAVLAAILWVPMPWGVLLVVGAALVEAAELWFWLWWTRRRRPVVGAEALVGVTALVGGLLKDIAPLRTGALALLGVALGKVFLYDLATLTPIARVASFIVLGLLLLGGAFAWQRMRPRAIPDLRAMPEALR